MTNEIAAALKDVREAIEHFPAVKYGKERSLGFRGLELIESQLADAKPVAFQLQLTVRQIVSLLRGNAGLMDNDPLSTAADILDKAQHERVLFGGIIEPAPTAQPAGPGDEERRQAWATMPNYIRLTDGYVGDGHDCLMWFLNHADTISAALQTPAVPAGVTVLDLCQCIDILAECIPMSEYMTDPELKKQKATIAAAQEIVGKRG